MSKANSRILITTFIILVVMMIAGMVLKSDIMVAVGVLGIISVAHTCIIVEELTAKLAAQPQDKE